MGVLHPGADGTEQLQAPCHIRLVLIAPRVDRLAIDIVHHEIRHAVVRAAAIDDAGDRRVIQPRENLSLLAKSSDDLLVYEPGSNDLDCDSLVERVVDPVCQVYRAHPAAANFMQDSVRAEAPAFHGRRRPRL